MNWSHLVRVRTVVSGRAVRLSVYCYRDRSILRAVGDCDVARGERVAVRTAERWECVLDGCERQCDVLRYRPVGGTVEPHRIVTYRRRGGTVYPVMLKVSADDCEEGILRWEQLAADGICYPASKAPYTRMAPLSPEEWEAYGSLCKSRLAAA